MEALTPRSALYPDPAAGDLRSFAATIRGRTILPSDPGYDDARQVHNLAVDRRPAIVVRPAGADDIARSVAFARASGRELAVRSGGHSLAGYGTADDAIVVDLSAMKGLHIDPDRRLAWAQAGLTAGEYGAVAAAHGLATPFGDTASVGVGGITLGGGIGWLARKHGMAIDSLVSAEVVLADGSIVTASEDENPDLFWAIRGGGGNFGIVTRFQYRLHPVDIVLGGALFLPATSDVLRGLVEVSKAAPDELTMIAFVMGTPPLPMIPAEAHGRLSVAIMPVFAGDLEAGQAAMAPFRALAEPIADLVGPMPYTAMYELTKEASAPSSEVIRSLFAHDLDAASADTIMDFMTRPSSPMAIAQIRVLGGAMGRVPNDATAFAHRDKDVMVTIINIYEGERAPHEAWTTEFFAALSGIADGVYSNFLQAEGDGRVRDAYPGATFERLVAAKRRYDPSNLFHLNQNIRP